MIYPKSQKDVEYQCPNSSHAHWIALETPPST